MERSGDEEEALNRPEVEMGTVGLISQDSILSDPAYLRKRNRSLMIDFLAHKPHPICNVAALGFGLTSLILFIVLLLDAPEGKVAPANKSDSSLQFTKTYCDENTNPECGHGLYQAEYDYRGRPRQVTGERGIVAADHGRCSEIGLAAMEAGGNAVDAAVATALCQGVLSPGASGIGGGAFILVRLPNGTTEFIDAREPAPAAANETMYGDQPKLSLDGGLAAAVPMELRGLWLAHQRHGKAAWADLVAPAVDLARHGFKAHPYLVAQLSTEPEALWHHAALRDVYYIRDGKHLRAPRINETCCRRPQLAELLEAVAQEGPNVLYSGRYAQGFVDDIQKAGGIITLADLRNAHPVIRKPLSANIWGLDFVTAPPPSSGAAILTALQILAGYREPLAPASVTREHRVVEAMKHAFALRLALADFDALGGTAASNASAMVADMLSPAFAAELRGVLSDDRTQPDDVYGGRWRPKDGGVPSHPGTSHMSIVDADRMAVALTSTVNTKFGSKVISPSTGILLNNQMNDFSLPGQNNTYGLAPSEANFIRPGKRPLSSMAPTLVVHNGTLWGVVGASGGPKIVSAVLETLLRVFAEGYDPLSAITAPRLHHQYAPNVVEAEHWAAGPANFTYPAAFVKGLEAKGHHVSLSGWGAVTQAIVVDPDTSRLTGASDPRKDGAPAGF